VSSFQTDPKWLRPLWSTQTGLHLLKKQNRGSSLRSRPKKKKPDQGIGALKSTTGFVHGKRREPSAGHAQSGTITKGRSLQDRALEPWLLQLHASTTVDDFWLALQRLLNEAVPFDALIVYLNFFDFASSWRAARILATPNAQRPVRWFEERRAVDMTPQFVLSRSQRTKVYRLSDVIPATDELRRTAFFQHYLAPGGWHYLAVSLFWNGQKVTSEYALRRTEGQGDFTDAELRLLHRLHPHIETVLSRLIEQEEARAQRQWLEEFSDHLPYALIFLDLELVPIYGNREAHTQCAQWNFGTKQARAIPARDVFRIPELIERACLSLKKAWLSHNVPPDSSELSLSARLTHPRDRQLTANVALRTDMPGVAAKPGFVIYLSQESRIENLTSPLPVHSLLSRLSPAEQEVARRVVLGESNREIASGLHKSVFTVKSHLTRIYDKLRVRSRSQMLVLLRS